MRRRRSFLVLPVCLLAATMLNAACASSSTYGCSNDARTATERLITDLSDYATVLNPAFMDDCDSGGSVYVSFYVTGYQEAMDEIKQRANCVAGGSPGVQLTEGDAAMRCTFPHADADVIVSNAPLGGEAEVLESHM